MKKIYGFLIAIVVLTFANFSFGENVKTEIDPEKGGLVVYEQTAFHPLPDWLLDKDFSSDLIFEIIKKGEGEIFIETTEETEAQFGFPIRIISKKITLLGSYSNGNWESIEKNHPPDFLNKTSWAITIGTLILILLLFIISFSHQIENKERIKSGLIIFYIILFWQIVFFGFLANRLQPTNILIYLFFVLLFFGSMALAVIGVYFGGKTNDVKVNGFMAIISLLIFLLAIFVSVFLLPDISILLGIVSIFIIINLLAYLASRLWFKKQPA